MKRKSLSGLIVASMCIFNSSLAVSSEPTESECAQTLQATTYPGLAADQNDEIIKEMKEAEKKLGSCAALNTFYCLIGNPACKQAR